MAGGLRVGPRINNFGDLLGPEIARQIVSERGLSISHRGKRLVAVGSILHLAGDGDVIWGSGVNGKVGAHEFQAQTLDIRAVRGPLTRDWLYRTRGIEAPEVYGDPGLLVPALFPDLVMHFEKRRALTVIPNLNERADYAGHPAYVDPRNSWRRILRTIAESEIVVGSSLHAMVLADALGVPNALIASRRESPFKYQDYYEGTGRPNFFLANDLASAESHARSLAQSKFEPLSQWDFRPLLYSFPDDLWSGKHH